MRRRASRGVESAKVCKIDAIRMPRDSARAPGLQYFVISEKYAR
jgi:hypothetical protein